MKVNVQRLSLEPIAYTHVYDVHSEFTMVVKSSNLRVEFLPACQTSSNLFHQQGSIYRTPYQYIFFVFFVLNHPGRIPEVCA